MINKLSRATNAVDYQLPHSEGLVFLQQAAEEVNGGLGRQRPLHVFNK